MFLTPEEKQVGKENFFAAVGSRHVRRTRQNMTSEEFLLAGINQGVASGKGLGSHYFGYGPTVPSPVRVGVIGTGDEGSVLIGALNPAFVEVKAIADIRPYSQFRAFHGEVGQPARPGLMSVYGWKTEDEAHAKVKVYERWQDLIAGAKADGVEAIIIALPLFLHAPVAIAAMRNGLHVLTEKLMGHSVRECKEMALVAKETGLYLATGHQRHYNILYDNAVELVRNGVLGDIHYIAAQWHRGNLPGRDSWKPPLPPGEKDTKETNELLKDLDDLQAALAKAESAEKSDPKAIADLKARIAQKTAQIQDRIVEAEKHGYEAKKYTDAQGKLIYDRSAMEELICWRLWDRTGGGMMAELGSHQLDAASIFIAAMHGGQKQHPLSVAGAANRPIFPPDRDIEDHVYCIFEFPAPGYDPQDPVGKDKRIGVQYSSINGNGFGGYGETVCGTGGTLVLERELEPMLYKVAATTDKTKVAAKKTKDKSGAEHVTRSLEIDEQGDARALAVGQLAMLPAVRGYTEEIEHWAWCIRNADPENQPRCRPEVALGDAVIALVANMAAREGRRIDFQEAWFHAESPATPEGVPPDPARYGA